MVEGLISTFRHELVVTVLVSVFIGGAMWPVRKLKAAYKEHQDVLQGIKTELAEQRSNCLTTLQDQGKEQIKLLGKAVDTLGEMHTDTRILLDRLGRN